MNEFFYALGDFFTATFKFLPALGNGPNSLIILAIFGFLVYWVMQLQKFNSEEEF